jgi:YrbI family 3-deoxy-D-manno-octulosonate 8-phosphate phosphatase
MTIPTIIDWHSITAIVCDFDGVLTDNFVYLDQAGTESVRCSRADGLAFDALRALGIPVVILSTEKNPVVRARAEKLQVPVIQGIERKHAELQRRAAVEKWDLARVAYVGNDLNDLQALELCGHRICPSDAHPAVSAICNIQLTSRGGEGVMREFVEHVLAIDIVAALYPKEPS